MEIKSIINKYQWAKYTHRKTFLISEMITLLIALCCGIPLGFSLVGDIDWLLFWISIALLSLTAFLAGLIVYRFAQNSLVMQYDETTVDIDLNKGTFEVHSLATTDGRRMRYYAYYKGDKKEYSLKLAFYREYEDYIKLGETKRKFIYIPKQDIDKEKLTLLRSYFSTSNN